MPKELKGFAMPFRAGAGRIPAPADTSDLIRASIERIIQTRRGERAMRPEVGSRCWDFAHENESPLLLSRIRAEVRGALAAQEPRIRVISVDAHTFASLPEFPGAAGVRIDVTYRVGGRVDSMSTSLVMGGSSAE